MERAAQFTPYVAVETNGITFLVSTTDRKMAKFFASRKRTELRVLDAALAHIEAAGIDLPRTTFVDVGAYIGTTTLAALGAGFSFVLACEPEPGNARLLRANVALNDAHDSVRVLDVALSNRAGTALLDLGPGSRGKARVLHGTEDEARGGTVEVRLARLDDLVAEGLLDPTSVALLWLDVEGHECQVLEGASAVLARSPALVMELYPELLRRAGMIERLPGLLTRHYTHVADLRHAESELVPVDRVPQLIERYDGSHTDLLLCRLPPG